MSITQMSIPIVARSIGKKMNVKVKFGHEQPATDGEVIYLPDLPLDDVKTKVLGLGFVVHEAGHIRFTGFDTDKPISLLHKHIRNVFEDVRMEKAVMSIYPGAKKVLCELVDYLVADNFFKGGGSDQTPAQVLSRYLLYNLRTSVLGQTALSQLAKASCDDVESILSDKGMTRVHSVMSRVVTASSTLDVHNLALEVITILEEEVEPPEEDHPEEPKNEPADDTDDGEQQTPDEMDDKQSSDDGSTDTAEDNTQQEVSDGCLDKDAVQAMLDATEDQLDKDLFESIIPEQLDEAVVEAEENGAICCGDGSADVPPLPLGDHAAVYASAYKQTYALRTRLQSFVQATKRVKRGTSQHGRNLNDKKLHRVKLGNPSIYRTRQRKKAVNTVVQVLMDSSYSMSDRNMMGLASNATLAITAALETIPGVRVGAAAFPGRQADVEPMTLFGEKVKQTAARYPAIVASGGTPLLPALMWATRQLLSCNEERKLLLIVTDGEPFESEACVDVMSQMKLNNIETMGLGIKVPSVKDLFNISACIDNEEELAKAIFSMLQDNLLQNVA